MDSTPPHWPTPIMSALYGHAFDQAERLAVGSVLSLWEAAALGRMEDLKRLQLMGLDVNLPAPDGFTALHLACYFGQPEAARWLLSMGADPLAPGPWGLHPIHSAAACPREPAAVELTDLLLFNGADVNAVQRGGFTALHAAAQRGSQALAKRLLAGGAEASICTEKGELAEDLALAKGHTTWVEWFRHRS